ncbi:unconventional myosin-XVIIIa isoform X10 [Tachysurus ichikawai]
MRLHDKTVGLRLTFSREQKGHAHCSFCSEPWLKDSFLCFFPSSNPSSCRRRLSRTDEEKDEEKELRQTLVTDRDSETRLSETTA